MTEEDPMWCVMNSILSQLLVLETEKWELFIIFVSAKLASYVKFYQTNKDFIDSLGHGQDEASHVHGNGCGIQGDLLRHHATRAVDAFVIDPVRTEMVSCKIDQTQFKVIVSHSAHLPLGSSSGSKSTTAPTLGSETWPL